MFAEWIGKARIDQDPCLTCVDIIMFEQDDFASPTMPREICLAGYRSKYCEFSTYTCYKSGNGVGYPEFCDAAVASGNGDDVKGYPVENICQRKKAETGPEVAEHSAEDAAK